MEEIFEYGVASSLAANVSGLFEREVHMFFGNKLKNGHTEQNFIKPPMCDGTGNILYGPNPLGLGFSGNSNTNTQYTSSGDSALFGTFGDGTGVNIPITSRGVSHLTQILNAVEHIGSNSANYTGSYPYVNHALTRAQSSVISTVLTDIIGTNQTITCMDWPDLYSPSESTIQRDYALEFGTANYPQIMANLANVKCFPIGTQAGTNCYNDSLTNENLTAAKRTTGANNTLSAARGPIASVAKNPTYRFCYRPMSGLLGTMSEKMFATMLIAPQQLYMQIHTSAAHIFFNVSADPCRRVAGTVRDYVRNIGQQNGLGYGAGAAPSTYTLASGKGDAMLNTPSYSLSSYAPGYGPYLSIPLNASATVHEAACPNTVFSDAACLGNANVQAFGTDTSGIEGTKSLGRTASSSLYVLPPTPQYVLSTTPWIFKNINQNLAGNAPFNFALETDVFYGTYLEHSVPQSRRIFDLNSGGGSRNSSIIGAVGSFPTGLTYLITNVQMVGDQIIVPNTVAEDIIRQAESGNFNVTTTTIRTYTVSLQAQATQTVILPLKVNMAQKIGIVFQDNRQRSAASAAVYDSNCGINPFALIDIPATPIVSTISGFNNAGVTALSLKGVGYTTALQYTPVTTRSGAISAQLRIGNDFFPQQPLTSMVEVKNHFFVFYFSVFYFLFLFFILS